jgi:hypothetical protein
MPDPPHQPADHPAGTRVFYLGGTAEVTYTGPVDFMTTDGGRIMTAHAPSASHATDVIDRLDAADRARRRWAVWPCGTSPARYRPPPHCGEGRGDGGERA